MTTDNHDQALEARAFKLLADTLEADGYESVAMMLRAGRRVDLCERHVILAIIAALREGQKAGGQEAVASIRIASGTAHDFKHLASGLPDGQYMLYTTPQPPPGYALVPMEPTEAMVKAMTIHLARLDEDAEEGADPDSHTLWRNRGCAEFIYRDLIAAAGAAGGE